MLDIGYRMLENPILIADKSWSAIAMTPRAEIPDDNSWNEFLKDGFLSPDTIASSIKDQLVAKIDTSKLPFKWLSVDMKYPRLFGKIKLNGSTPALISVLEYNRKFIESDYQMLEILCDAAAAELQKSTYQQHGRGAYHEDLFINILEGRFRDPNSINERIKVLNLRLAQYLYVFVFDTTGLAANQISLTYLRDDIEKMLDNGKALIYNGTVVAVASFAVRDDIGKATADLGLFLERFNIRCGIGRSFEQLAELRVHYEQAVNALNIGQHMDPNQLFYFYGEYAIYHAAKTCADSGMAQSFIHPGLKALNDFDKEHNTDFVYTLGSYLRYFGNITNMSRAMSMHRNTSIYRLQRLAEIMNVSLSDYCALEQITFSLRVMEAQKKIARKILKDTGPAADAESP